VEYIQDGTFAYERPGFLRRYRKWLIALGSLLAWYVTGVFVVLAARAHSQPRTWIFDPPPFKVYNADIGEWLTKGARSLVGSGQWWRRGLFGEFRAARLRDAAPPVPRFTITRCDWPHGSPSPGADPAALATELLERFLSIRPRHVLSVVDQKGIRGAALLAFWEQRALRDGHTAVLVTPGEGDSIRDLITDAWDRYGHVPVSAEWLLDRGGFVILVNATGLETLNGDTRKVIRDLSRANAVIIASRASTDLHVSCELAFA
jgi:hypothetical protein